MTYEENEGDFMRLTERLREPELREVRATVNLAEGTGGVEICLGMLAAVAESVPNLRRRTMVWEPVPVGFAEGDYERYKLLRYLLSMGEVRRAPFRLLPSLILDDSTSWTELDPHDRLIEDPDGVRQAAKDFETAWSLSMPLLPEAQGDLYQDTVVDGSTPERTVLLAGTQGWTDRIRRLAASPSDLFSMSPRTFELLVAELLQREGYEVSVTPQTRDGGRDILAFERTPTGDHLFLVECKRYAPHRPVDVSLVRALYGVVTSERANGGLLVATSYFSPDAIRFRERDAYHLALSDYKRLTTWIEDSAAGNWRVRRQPG